MCGKQSKLIMSGSGKVHSALYGGKSLPQWTLIYTTRGFWGNNFGSFFQLLMELISISAWWKKYERFHRSFIFFFFAAQIKLGTFFISAEKDQDCVKKSSLGSLRKLLQTFSLFSNPGFSSDTETCVTICSLQSLPFPPSPEPKSIQPGIISRGYFFLFWVVRGKLLGIFSIFLQDFFFARW